MVVETDGYLALIEHLSLNLDIFTTERGDTGSESIEDVVTDMVASNIMMIFEQNPELHSSVRFKLLKEADAVVEDLGEVLAGVWGKKATNEQITFLEEYVALVKNLLITQWRFTTRGLCCLNREFSSFKALVALQCHPSNLPKF